MIYFLLFLFSVLITVYCYVRIFRVADEHEKKIQKDMVTVQTGTGQNSCTRERKAHKTILIIIGAFAVCWLPYTVGTSWKILTGKTTAPYWFANIGLTLALFNSCVNPMVYTIRDTRFRRGARKILCGCVGQSRYRQGRNRTLSSTSTSKTTNA